MTTSTSETFQHAADVLRDIISRNRTGHAAGVCSVCSAHPWVLEATLAETKRTGSLALIESTSNQVNQFGGYTGQTPAQFAVAVKKLAIAADFPSERLLLGGDHLGPHPWRQSSAQHAMEHAGEMVRDYVLAGYGKIHLDASMTCASDPAGALDPLVAAARAARLCRAAEDAWRRLPAGSPAPLYVIGTEVPIPGGEQLESGAPTVTRVEDARSTVAQHQAAFAKLGLEEAFSRVIGLVVQPGVEFGSDQVFAYDREPAKRLSFHLPEYPALVYEAHSTDYQPGRALRELVEDHYAILKVGPWLTFAMREAIFALAAVEREWLGWRTGVELSRLPEVLDGVMVRNPEHWKNYYQGGEGELRFARAYSFSDRCRYYWPRPEVRAALDRLVKNLTDRPAPLPLLSQFLPVQYEAVIDGSMAADPASLVKDRIAQVLRLYASATG